MKTTSRPAKPIASLAQARRAKEGVYPVKGMEGVYFKKESDAEGAGSFFRRYRARGIKGRRRAIGLGPLAQFTELAELRRDARRVDDLLAEGKDPLHERDGAAKAAELVRKVDFVVATEAYLAAHARSWKHKYAVSTWLNPIKKYAYPVLAGMNLNAVEAEHIANILIAADEDGNFETGLRVRASVEAIFSAAMVRKQRDRSLGNPAAAELVGQLFPLKRRGDRPHFRRLVKIVSAPTAFLALSQARGRAQGIRAAALDVWLFMIACASRPSEALGARWSEINFEERLWTIPAERMKSGKAHVVPLSSLALAILDRRIKLRVDDEDFVFPGKAGQIGYANFARAPEEMEVDDIGSPHSWRSVFRDWCADIGGVSFELAESALAHSLSAVVKAYRRSAGIEPRRKVMQDYADWITSVDGVTALETASRAAA
jgi:integrase